MQTKLLMNLSAAWMALLGLIATFLPQETLAYCGASPNRLVAGLVQVLGAVYLGFAMLNWMARENLIGGIYSRPVAMGNMVHFLVAGLGLLKICAAGVPHREQVMVAAVIYAAFALWYGLVVFRHPLRQPVPS